MNSEISAKPPTAQRVAVVIPCRNEGATIADVVGGFKSVLPDAKLYVFDNNSSDSTSNVAREAGGEVVFSPKRGKGNVLRHVFEVVDADAYVLVSGDGHYPSESIEGMLSDFWAIDADMAVGIRLEDDKTKSFRPLRKLGHRIIARLVSALFGTHVHDVLSSYRIISRDFASRIYLRSNGSEVEAEIAVQCLSRGFKLIEIPVPMNAVDPSIRRKNSFGEGIAILKAIIWTFRSARPGFFFKWIGVAAFVIGFVLGWPLAFEYYQSGTVVNIPYTIAATALEVAALFLITVGTLLSRVNQQHMETQSTLRDLLKRGESAESD